MADIELVIRIDKEDYETMKHNIAVDNPLCPLNQKEMVTKIANGTPLDEIRAEIESQRKEVANKHTEDDELQAFYDGLNDGLKDARDILDKYIADMRGEEDG